MTVETFFANFGHLADAPNGVQKLRELILQLAVQGKFSDHHSQKGWRSYTLGDLGAWGSGGTPSSKETRFYGGDIPWLIIRDLNDGLVLHAANSITKEGLENSSAKVVPPNTLLIAMYGSIGKLGVTGIECATNQAIAFCQPDDELVDLWFLFHYLRAIRTNLLARGQGLAQQNISQKILKAVSVKLPPLEDQKRIVAKVDQLMALCDELESRQQKQQQGRVRLNNSALDALLTAHEPIEFAVHWQRISTNFDLLYDHPETIAKLRAAILQLAVQGKLVLQDPNDEPASVLLERIKAEKERLVEKGKTKLSKPLPEIRRDEMPFELSEGWAWARGEMIADFVDPHPSHRTPPEFSGGVPYVGYTDIDHVKGINFLNARKVNPKVFEEHQARYQLKVGDFVFGKIGTLGEPFFLSEPFDYCLSANLILIQPNQLGVVPKYLAIYLDSPVFINILGDQKTNSTHGVFGIKKARLISIPLPPFEEQKRIVAKVDQLMTLCDELEAKLNQAQQHSEKLMEATVRQLLVA